MDPVIKRESCLQLLDGSRDVPYGCGGTRVVPPLSPWGRPSHQHGPPAAPCGCGVGDQERPRCLWRCLQGKTVLGVSPPGDVMRPGSYFGDFRATERAGWGLTQY